MQRFNYNGISYEDIPQYRFSIISKDAISDQLRRDILKWLIGRNGFKKFVIHQSDLQDYYYYCVFTDVDIIYVGGVCHGFRLTANFDSPYARRAPTSITITGLGTVQTVSLLNNSDIIDDYVYPSVVFRAASESFEVNISIINVTDNPSRAFIFTELSENEQITVDNELKIITSSLGGEKLSNFNKNWLRLKPGVNTLNVLIKGSVTVTCPAYIKMGF